MSRLVFNRDGGKTDEFGHLLGLARSMQGEVIEGLLVAANGSPNMTVNVPIGTAMIPTSSGGTAYKYFVGLDATESVAITTANPSNPRNDLIVLYVDVAVTASQSYTNNSNNMLKLAAVAGTPAASPADPSIANIQAAIGAANPYIILARVVVGAGVTQINTGNITDLRNLTTIPRAGTNSVGTNSITDGSVTNQKIASGIAIEKISNPYKFHAYCSSGKTIANTSLVVDFQTELFDPNNNFDTSTSRYTAPISGYYQINAQVWMGVAGAGSAEYCNIFVRKNASGNILESMRHNGSDNANRLMRPNVSAIVYLAAGDYIDVVASFTGSRDIAAGQTVTFFNGFLVSV